MKSEYIKTLKVADMTMADDVALTTTDFVDVMTYKVPPKQKIFFGNGKINLGVDDRGTFKMDLNTDVPGDIAGVSRLLLRDANGISSTFIREDISSDYESGVKVGKGGKTGNEPAPFVTQDEYLVIQAKADSAATASKADSTLELPVTIQAL